MALTAKANIQPENEIRILFDFGDIDLPDDPKHQIERCDKTEPIKNGASNLEPRF